MQTNFLRLADLADKCQLYAYNMNFRFPDSDVGWWGLHETTSLFHQYVLEKDEERYMDVGRYLYKMWSQIPAVDNDVKNFCTELELLVFPQTK